MTLQLTTLPDRLGLGQHVRVFRDSGTAESHIAKHVTGAPERDAWRILEPRLSMRGMMLQDIYDVYAKAMDCAIDDAYRNTWVLKMNGSVFSFGTNGVLVIISAVGEPVVTTAFIPGAGRAHRW